MKLIEFFRIIKLSFYSPSVYLAVANNWKHWGLGFLLRFSILVSIITSISLLIVVSSVDFKSAPISSIIEQIPDMNVIENKVSFVNQDLKSPITIANNISPIIVDLEAKSIEAHSENFVVFTPYGITLNIIEANPFSISYADFLQEANATLVNSDSITSFLIKNQRKILVMILLLGVSFGSLVYFILTLLKILFYSSMASIFATLFKLNLDFKQLTRLAVIANAPAFILSTIFMLVFYSNKLADLEQIIATSLYLLYFIFAVYSCAKIQKVRN